MYGSKKILVVDDEEIAGLITKENFSKLGCSIDVATTGAEALRLAQQNLYDLIILDINIFDMDGFNVAKNIKNMEGKIKNVPLVAVTIHALNSLKRRAKELGFKEYIVKPLSFEMCKKLLDQLSEWTKTTN
jgi:CheY-like chemotaxis protein